MQGLGEDRCLHIVTGMFCEWEGRKARACLGGGAVNDYFLEEVALKQRPKD